MPEKVKRFKHVCKCESCGNEAEMVVTCSLEEVPEAPQPASAAPPDTAAATPHRVKGSAVCEHCGNEADMWVDL